MIVYYDSKTGNVEKFINNLLIVKAKEANINIEAYKIDENLKIENKGHFITYTSGKGAIPSLSKKFLDANSSLILTISSSGSIAKHEETFAMAVDKGVSSYGLKAGIKFDKSGKEEDALALLELFKEIS